MLFSQTALLWFEVLPDLSPVLPGLLLALPGLSPVLPGAPRLVVGAARLVAGAPSYSEGRKACSPRVWYSPEIDASKYTLHILSDTPGGFPWLKYILLMQCLDFQIHKTRNCWRSVEAHFHDAAGSVSLLFLPLQVANISSIDVCNQSEHTLPKMPS